MCRYTLSLYVYIYIHTWRGFIVYTGKLWNTQFSAVLRQSWCFAGHQELGGAMECGCHGWSRCGCHGCSVLVVLSIKPSTWLKGFSKTCPDPGSGGCEAGSGQVAGAHWFKATVLESYVFFLRKTGQSGVKPILGSIQKNGQRARDISECLKDTNKH
jgi:hypothetical protein